MRIDRTIEDELKTALEALQRQVDLNRRKEVDPNEITQHCDTLDMDWQDRLNDFEKGELRGYKRGFDAATKEFEHHLRMESYMRDSALLPLMSPEDQLAFWASNRNGGEGKLWADAQANMADQAYETSRQQIQDRYADLREGLRCAIDEVREGKEPSLTFLMESQIEKEAERASRAEAFVKQHNERDNDRDR